MRTTAMRSIRITHRPSGAIIAEGPLGFWGITPFEGNLYISRKCLKTNCLVSAGRSSLLASVTC
jgi:hypothetical protein